MIRRHFFLLGAGAFLALMVLLAALRLLAGDGGAGEGQGGGGRAAPVSQVAAAERQFADRIELLGVAKGRQSVTITSDTAELVSGVRFGDGQQVARGQVLVELKAVEQDAGVQEARARAEQAEREYERWRTLAERGVAPKAAAEQYKAAYDTALAALEAASARKLDRLIRAPFAGVVGITDIAPGALISPGTPIVTLDDISVIRVDFDVPDRYLPILREGMAIAARPDPYPGEAFSGRIARLDTRIDEETRTLRARAEFPNPSRRIKPGMLMRVALEHGQRQAVAVPEAAVQYEGDQAFVFVIAGRGEELAAQKRAVQAGVIEEGLVEIVAGLNAGERIVADGLNRIQDGQPVRLAGERAGS